MGSGLRVRVEGKQSLAQRQPASCGFYVSSSVNSCRSGIAQSASPYDRFMAVSVSSSSVDHRQHPLRVVRHLPGWLRTTRMTPTGGQVLDNP